LYYSKGTHGTKVKIRVIKNLFMGRVGGELHAFFNLLLDVGDLPLSDPHRFNSRENIPWFPVNGILRGHHLTLLAALEKTNILPLSEIETMSLGC
jgi:hypothetical protein